MNSFDNSRQFSRRRWLAAAVAGTIAVGGNAGCRFSSPNEVVVYAALDREFSEPILDDFFAVSGIRVAAKYDLESTKTIGLATAIEQEAARPRCDLFWNNEILHTLRVEKKGLLTAYIPSAAADFPANFRSPTGMWYGFAARARVLIVNRKLVSADQQPRLLTDLLEPKWKNKSALAKPLFGTTGTHAAVLASLWGREQTAAFFRQWKANGCVVMSGNKQVAEAVARGELPLGVTDTDDALIEKEAGYPVEIIPLGQSADQPGTLQIPNSLAIVAGAPHLTAAKSLVEFLLSPKVEEELATGRSGQIPLRKNSAAKSRALPSSTVWLTADFSAAAEVWSETIDMLKKEFVAP